MTNTAYKVRYNLFNSAMTGPSNRQSGQPGVAYHANYLLRSSWGTTDMLRGSMGTYWSPGTSIGHNALVQGSPFYGESTDFYGSTGAGAGGLLVATNYLSPLSVQIQPSIYNLGPLGARLTINPNLYIWNRNQQQVFGQTENAIAMNINIDQNDINHSGDPNWAYYVRGSTGIVEWGNPDTGVETTDLPGVINCNTIYEDYSTVHYGLSDNLSDRAAAGTNLQVEPVFQLTRKTYERDSKLATEPMLTNYYCLQSLAQSSERNRDVTTDELDTNDEDLLGFNSAEYFQQVTLGGLLQSLDLGGPLDADGNPIPDPLFAQISDTGYFTASQLHRLYDLYSKAVRQLQDAGTLEEVAASFNENYKNIVMLTSEVKPLTQLVAGDTEESRIGYLPFYNKITIPADPDGISAFPGIMEYSYLARLREALNAVDDSRGDRFLDVLQLYIITNLLGPAEPTYVDTVIHLSQPSGISHIHGTRPQPLRRVATFESFIDDCRNFLGGNLNLIGSTPSSIPGIISRLRLGSEPGASDNFILLRNTASTEHAPYEDAIATFIEMLDNDALPEPGTGLLPGFPARNARQLLIQPQLAPSETLMYEVKKRLLNPDGSPGDIVQTIIIGKPIGLPGTTDSALDVTYIDSQVKYGVRYYYEIHAIKVVYGNAYTYKDLIVKTEMISPPARAAGSYSAMHALGFGGASWAAAPDQAKDVVNYVHHMDAQAQDVSNSNMDQGPASRANGEYAGKKSGYFYIDNNSIATTTIAGYHETMASNGTDWYGRGHSGWPTLGVVGAGQPSKGMLLNSIQLQFVASDAVGSPTTPGGFRYPGIDEEGPE